MSTITAQSSGTFTLGGDLIVNRLGFGAMRITGAGVWGEPADRNEALRVLHCLPELDVNFVDTADSYGPEVSENLIREALHPYPGMVIATKGGLVRPGPNQMAAIGHPAYLRQCVIMSLRRLGVERIDLWQLHRIDPRTDRDAQFQAIAEMQREGLIRHVGLSEVSVDEVKAARIYFPVVSVQNRYNLTDRVHEAVLDYCEQENIAFIPWRPMTTGSLAQEGAVLDVLAKRLNVLPGQVALAWMLRRSPVMLPIPGTSSVRHLEENVAAAAIQLSDEDFQSIHVAGVQSA